MNSFVIRARSVLRIALLLLGLIVAPYGYGEESAFPTKPVLTIEGGMHSSVVRRVAVDEKNRYVATVSDDKTLRLWALPDGRLLRTLRVPFGLKNDGKLYAVAVSPNGRVVAVSGLTGWEWNRTVSIYLFDVQKGEIFLTIPGLSNVVNHLAFSPNGALLAAGLSGEQGLRVFNANSGQLLAEDRSYLGPCFWLDFASDGRLATASYDGFVRVYSNKMQLEAKKRPDESAFPYSVAFSHDGKKLAIGFKKRPSPMVVNAVSLEPLYSAEASDINVPMQVVAWSHDDAYLYAAGQYRKHERRMIRRWEQGGKPKADKKLGFKDIPASKDTIMQVLPLKDGTVAFVAADPVVGVLNQRGFQVFYHERPIAAFQGSASTLRIAPDASSVLFEYEANGDGPALFSVKKLELKNKPPADRSLIGAISKHKGLTITGWNGNSPLTINGVALDLKDNETPYSVSITHDGNFFVLGTSFNLCLYTSTGQEIWKVPAPAAVWGVAISGNNRWIVATYGDGIIRWHTFDTGSTELNLYPHTDRKRWVIWRPSGIFASSAGADSLIGWQRNTTKEQAAEFYPASRLSKEFKRPDSFREFF